MPPDPPRLWGFHSISMPSHISPPHPETSSYATVYFSWGNEWEINSIPLVCLLCKYVGQCCLLGISACCRVVRLMECMVLYSNEKICGYRLFGVCWVKPLSNCGLCAFSPTVAQQPYYMHDVTVMCYTCDMCMLLRALSTTTSHHNVHIIMYV